MKKYYALFDNGYDDSYYVEISEDEYNQLLPYKKQLVTDSWVDIKEPVDLDDIVGNIEERDDAIGVTKKDKIITIVSY